MKTLVDDDIKIVQWIKFKNPDAKEQLKKIAQESKDRNEFISKLKNMGINILKCMVLADNFYKK